MLPMGSVGHKLQRLLWSMDRIKTLLTSKSIISLGCGASGFSPVSVTGMLSFLISFSKYRNFLSISSHLRTSFTNFRWKALTSGLSYREKNKNKISVGYQRDQGLLEDLTEKHGLHKEKRRYRGDWKGGRQEWNTARNMFALVYKKKLTPSRNYR